MGPPNSGPIRLSEVGAAHQQQAQCACVATCCGDLQGSHTAEGTALSGDYPGNLFWQELFPARPALERQKLVAPDDCFWIGVMHE